ncbi:hypothetical protein MTO96_007699 [Rhipicephalus appendiculatus]
MPLSRRRRDITKPCLALLTVRLSSSPTCRGIRSRCEAGEACLPLPNARRRSSRRRSCGLASDATVGVVLIALSGALVSRGERASKPTVAGSASTANLAAFLLKPDSAIRLTESGCRQSDHVSSPAGVFFRCRSRGLREVSGLFCVP